MSKLLTIWNYIRHHKYMITLLVFLVVIGFLDENSLIQRAKHRNAVDSGAIERIAREKYLMKKPNEDVYVFEQ